LHPDRIVDLAAGPLLGQNREDRLGDEAEIGLGREEHHPQALSPALFGTLSGFLLSTTGLDLEVEGVEGTDLQGIAIG
jgi:hypothetical protein